MNIKVGRIPLAPSRDSTTFRLHSWIIDFLSVFSRAIVKRNWNFFTRSARVPAVIICLQFSLKLSIVSSHPVPSSFVPPLFSAFSVSFSRPQFFSISFEKCLERFSGISFIHYWAVLLTEQKKGYMQSREGEREEWKLKQKQNSNAIIKDEMLLLWQRRD